MDMKIRKNTALMLQYHPNGWIFLRVYDNNNAMYYDKVICVCMKFKPQILVLFIFRNLIVCLFSLEIESF